MVGPADRPVPRAHGIDPGERIEVLRELLTIERQRLINALKLEQERNIVFPETTVIVKDIERLLEALGGKATGGETDMRALLAKTGSIRQVTRQFRQG